MKAQTLNESLGSSLFNKYIFLSYRRKDRDYVTKVAEFLEKLSAKVYIDYLDDELPSTPSDATAIILRSRIQKCRKVIQFVTPNSSGSKWMPWELGLGDGLLGYRNSVILPTSIDSNNSVDQEYLNIYGSIKMESIYESFYPLDDEWIVKYPQGQQVSLKVWLNN
ncbi:toll/interleukin-1 receptor domain-containing protein [Spirosoma taeanense]|uniref:Toll/interleukin-1 receptor domain-containing protein n=1 Tax=Spirosoma taeanense TaxID=2735870 RepID=A0A6M5Y3S3_9BACT|nr:toll/interleukin-1 receptor domain-containing protein [Spirosoma taeanense]QJW89228.1 toll/interleukin-1 receptor domain-containing protein [Spirosoma taeanense]